MLESSYYDLQQFRHLFVCAQKPNQLNFHIEGVKCPRCVLKLENLALTNPLFSSVKVNLTQKSISIDLNQANTKISEVVRVITELGYTLTPLTTEIKPNKSSHTELSRLGITGFCAGNIMLLSISIYSGLQSSTWISAFNWLSFLLFLPIILISVKPFYMGAKRALVQGYLNADLPIIIAFFVGSFLSILNLLRGSPHVYFDSTSAFIFLILTSRYFLNYLQNNTLTVDPLENFFDTPYVRILRNNVEELQNKNQVQPGDQIIVKQCEKFPADGFNNGSDIEVDSSLLTGESMPLLIKKNERVYAGQTLLNEQAFITVEKRMIESRIAEIFKQLNQFDLRDKKWEQLSDRLAHYLLLTVFIIGALYFALYSATDFNQAFENTLALIIVACPCALAFAAPLTLALACRLAAQKGIIIKEPSSFEKLSKVKNIFFDKTGTLTTDSLSITSWHPRPPTSEQANLIVALEKRSVHPIAKALLQACSNAVDKDLNLENWHETPGVGPSADYLQDQYRIARTTGSKELSVSLYKNNEIIITARMSTELQDSAKEVIRYLRNKKYNLALLTGDQKQNALNLAKKLNLNSEQVHFELSPEDKQKYIETFPQTLYVGDGINDLLAFKKAFVSLALGGIASQSIMNADISFAKNSLSQLTELFKISKIVNHLLKRNLFLALLYNLVAGGLALTGHITPLLAAVLMPLNSVVLLLSSYLSLSKLRVKL